MITTAIALLLSLHVPQQDASEPTKLSASQIMSRVFSRYAAAQSAVGSIKMTQSAQNVSINIETELQFDRPSKLYLHQSRNGSRPGQWLVCSDGKEFSYDRPEGGFGKPRYVELVTQGGVEQKIGDFYMAAEKSLGEMNAMLDIAISQPSRLRRLMAQWATLTYQGKVALNGVDVQKITGEYRDDPKLAPSGKFEIYVNDAGDFVRYVVNERFMFPSRSKEPIDITTVWDSNIKLGAKTEPALYRVIGN